MKTLVKRIEGLRDLAQKKVDAFTESEDDACVEIANDVLETCEGWIEDIEALEEDEE